MTRRFAVPAALALLVACSGGDATGPSTPVPSALSIVTQPSTTAQSGVALPSPPVVRLRDAAGIPVALAGVVITAASTTAGVTLANTSATTDHNGIATFHGMTLTGLVGSYVLRFSSTGLTSIDAQAITLAAGAPAALALVTQPSATAQAGIALAAQPVVQLRDASGNNASQAGVTVTATLVTGSPTVSSATALTNAAGQATFAGLTLSGAVGSYTLRFSASGLGSVDAAAPTALAGGAPTQLALITAPAATAVNGVVFTTQAVTQLRDAFGNDAGQAGVWVKASIATQPGGGGVLAGDSVQTGATGQATFAGMKITGAAGAYSVRFAATGLSSIVAPVTVSASAATKLGVTTQPSLASQSGAALAIQPVVQLQDQSGNAVATAGIVVHAVITPGGSAALSNDSATTDATGKATFSGLAITGTVGAYAFQFSATGVAGASAANTTFVSAGAATRLFMVTQPSFTATNAVALAVQPAVRLRDAANNNVSQAGVVVTATLVSGTLTLDSATATTSGTGVATFSGLKLTGLVGNYTLRFTSGTLASADASAPTVLSAGAAAQVGVSVQPATTAASGVALAPQPAVQLRDVSGNPVAQGGVQVTASVVGGGPAVTNATATTLANGSATFAGLTLTGLVGNYTLRFSSGALTAADAAAPLALGHGAATALAVVTAPPPAATSGAALVPAPVVEVRDASGNAVTQAGVVVHASLTPAGATLSNDSATTDGTGRATFTGLAITGPIGAYTLQFSATGLAGAAAGNATTISAGTATRLIVTTQPSVTATNGVKLAQQPAVRLQDASNNNVSQAGVVVTASLVSGSLTLDSATATTGATGVATFSGLKLTGLVGSYTLRFSAGGLTGADASAPTVLSAGAATQLSLTAQPATAAANGSALAPQPVAQLRDVSGNAVSQGGVQVTASVAGGGPVLGNATATTIADGSASFAGLALTGLVGNYTLRFSAGGLLAVDAAAPVVLGPGAATALSIETAPPPAAVNGAALTIQPVVNLLDQSGNAVPQAGVMVHAALTPAGAALDNDSAATDANGRATFSGLAVTGATGAYFFQFSAPGLTGTSTVSSTFLSAGSANKLVLTVQPSTAAQNAVVLGQQPVVQLQDNANNNVNQAGVVVTASLVTGSLTLENATATTDANGTAAFASLRLTGLVGSYTLRFSAAGVAGVDAGGATVLSAGPATQLALTAQPSITATNGAVLGTQPVAQLRDVSGNVVAQGGVQVDAAVVGGGPALSNGSATTLANGSASFAGLALTGLVGNYTLRFSSGSLQTVDAAAPLALGPGAPDTLAVVTAPPAAAVNGALLAPQPAVQLRDQSGNAVLQAGVVVHAALTPGGATLSNDSATTDGTGTATFSGMVITGAGGAYTFQFSAPGGLATSSAGATVLSPSAATQLAMVTQPSLTATNAIQLAQQPAVRLQDGSNNNVSQAGIQVTASLVSGSLTLANATATTDGAGVATFANLTLTGLVGGYTLRFSAGGVTSVDAAAPTVLSAGAAAQLSLTTQPSLTATNGTMLGAQPVVQLRDVSGNVVSQGGVQVDAAVVGGGPALTNGSATTIGDGSATFAGLTLTGLVGTYTLRFSSGALATVDAAAPLALGPGAADTLAIVTAPPANATNGAVLSPQPAVQLRDQSGNVVPQAGIMVHAALSPAGATLSNDSAATDGTGTATFSGMAITGIAGSYSFNFTATGLGGVSSAGATVLGAGAATKLAMVTQPSLTATNAVALTQQPAVRLQDGSSNNVSQAGVVVTASLVSGSLTIDSATATTDGGGVATFSGLKLTGLVGSYTLRFSAGGLASVDAAAPTVLSAGAATQLTLTTQPPVTGASGAVLSSQPVVQLRDTSGNAVSQLGVLVNASVVNGGPSLANGSATSIADGSATFAGLALTGLVGNYTLRFSSGALQAVDAAAPLALGPGAADTIIILTAPPANAVNGAVFGTAPVVEVRDAAGNPIPGLSVDAGAPGNVTVTGRPVTTLGNGQATFSGLTLTGVATGYSVRFCLPSCSVINVLTVATTPTQLAAGAAATATITTPASAAGQSGVQLAAQPSVTITDQSGNPVEGVTVTATVAGASNVANGSAVTNANGLATFTTLTVSGAPAAYTLTFTSGAASIGSALALAVGPAASLTIDTPPSNAINGQVLATQPVVTVRDATTNVIPGATVTVTTGAGATVSGGSVVTDAGGVATFTALGLSGTAGGYTLTFASGAAQNTAGVTLSAGAADSIALTQDPSANAQNGVILAQQPIVRITDGTNGIAGVIVTATVVGGGATLDSATATTNGSGDATFSGLTLNGPVGSHTLRFLAAGAGSLQVDAPATSLAAGAAAKLIIDTQPSVTAPAGAALTIQPVVRVTDVGGNTILAAGTQVTASLASSAGTVINATANTDASGVATFSGLAISALVGNHTLRFSAASLQSADAAAPTAITPGAASQLTLTQQPSNSSVIGQALLVQPVVQVRDAAGNAVPGAGTSISASVVTGAPTLSNTNALTDAQGLATFAGLTIVSPAGNYRFRFTSGGLAAATATDSTVAGTEITSGVPVTNLSGAALTAQTFAVMVGASDTLLRVQISGFGSLGEDADLYVRQAQATDINGEVHDCFPNAAGSTEQCDMTNLQPGLYYITIYGFFSYSNLTLLATRFF